jgi:mannose-6-phosphate isomerase-like protein (cupin superfamily)
MLIKKSQRKRKQLAREAFVYEYCGADQELGMAVSELNGRVPDVGTMKNKICHEAYYVMSGSAQVFIGNEVVDIGEGDVLQIQPGQEYYIEASNLRLIAPTAPAFYPEQWENIKTL